MLVAVPDDREWLTPITLTRKEPVAKFVLDPARAEFLFFKPVDHFRFGFGGGKTVEEPRMDGEAFADKGNFLDRINKIIRIRRE